MTRSETRDCRRPEWFRVGFSVPSILTVVAAQLLWLLPVASAQSIFASLSGTVRDTSGAVVAGADITVANEASGVVRKAVTGQDGFFSLTYLPAPASYRVLVVAKGFRKWQASGIALNSDDSRTMNNIELPVGAPTETVEVVSATQEIAVVDSGEKSAIISSKDLQNLSLVGRNATEYLKLLPGAALQANGGVNRPAYDGQVVGINGFATGASGAAGLSANTINGQSIEITQDGQHSFDPGAPGAATPVNPNPNMISEVKVLTSNFTSENIKGPVVVNTVTKSGGSAFHGEGYVYARNQAMNAEDAFNRQTEVQNGLAPGFLKVPSSYYFPGGNIGGPLIIPGTGFNKSRKKFFFFEGFELYRQDLDGGVDRSFVPTDAMLGGDFSALSQPQYANVGHSTVAHVPTTPAAGTRLGWDGPSGRVNNSFGGPCTGITGGVIDPGCIDPSAQALLRSYLPEPNADPSVSGFNYVQAFTVPQHSWQNVVRGDVNITDSTKAFITWSRQRETANMPMGLWNNSGDWTVPAPSNAVGANGSDSVSGTLLHVFSPTMVNETRFGYTKVNFPTSLTNPAKQTRAGVGFPLTGIFGNPNTPAVLSWGSTFPNLGDVGHAYHPTLIAVKGIPSVADNLTKVIKTHTLKTGFYYEHVYNKQDNWGQFMGVYAYGATGWGGGTSGNEYADALMGIGTAGYFEQAAPPPTNLAQNIAAFYVQDDWKLTRRITVQYGMRFEHYAKPYSDPFGLAVFNPSKYDASIDPNLNTQTGISWHSLDNSIPISGAKSRLFYYSPRVGAAIDLFGTGRTVVRGGWGRYRSYDSVQSNSYVQPAQTATGSSSWSCNWNDSACPTWEDVDKHALPKPVYGQGLPPGANKGVFVIDPNDDEQPVTTSYSLTVDQQLPAKFRMEMSYVGNNTEFLQGYTNLFNGIPLGTITQQARVDFAADCNAGGSDSLGSTACLAHFRKYPDYTTINTSVTAGKAQYDSLQVSLNRNVGFLTLQANYTWAKALGNGAVFSNGGLPAALSISNAEHYLRGILPNDRAHALSLAYVFNLPSLRSGSGFVKALANGWQISGITQVQSGAQIATQGGTNLNFNLTQGGTNQDNVHLLGSPDISLYPLITCNPTQGVKKKQFINPNCFAPAPAGQLGTGSIPYIPGPMFWNSDLTLIKNFRLTERQGLQFRFAAFNFLNHDLLSFVNNDNNLKLNFNDLSQVITGATMTYPGGTGPEGCIQNTIGATIHGITYPNGIPCSGTTTFGNATSHVGRRLIELGVKYTF